MTDEHLIPVAPIGPDDSVCARSFPVGLPAAFKPADPQTVYNLEIVQSILKKIPKRES